LNIKIQPNEEILWQGRPVFKPYINLAAKKAMSFLYFTIFVGILEYIYSIVQHRNPNALLIYILPIIALIIGIGIVIDKIICYKKIDYYITNQRVIIKTGDLEACVTGIPKNHIVSIDMKASKAEQKYNAGTILIHLGEEYELDEKMEKLFYKLESVNHPSELLKLF
jgi:uncharacterized membrane protein YdbT with pleckstrin-like domain